MARYSARAPVAESRLRYDAERAEVELVADHIDGFKARARAMKEGLEPELAKVLRAKW